MGSRKATQRLGRLMEMTARGKIKLSEQAILNTIYEYLLIRKMPVVHIRNTGTLIKRDGKTFFGKPKFDQKGAPDLIALIVGIGLAIEVKSETGRVSPEQIDWLAHWEKNGGRFVIARNVDHVIDAINKITIGG
jgi:hypothetical protein